MKEVKEILDKGKPSEVRGLFVFNKDTEIKLIRDKFRVWARWFFPGFFPYPDAEFHAKMDKGNIGVYTGRDDSFLNIAFRGSAKTARTKLFIAFAIANDENHHRRYIKVLSKDLKNARQSTTDVYNFLISLRVKALYPEIFKKTGLKREETMSSFTTATRIKMTADSLGSDQRGDIQDESRPDFVWYDDFETSQSLMSAVTTNRIWVNMEEARTGLSKHGGSIYTGNYLSERGNVHRLADKTPNQIIVSIEKEDERYNPSWPERDTAEDLRKVEADADDYAGEYRCKPEISQRVFFDRDSVDRQEEKSTIEVVAGFKIYKRYNPSHRIAGGHDVGGGVGLDYSTSVFLDFDQYPIQVIATYKSNEIKPDEFGWEIIRQAKRLGKPLLGIEKNYGSTLDIVKEHYPTSQLYQTEVQRPKVFYKSPTEFGWDTNPATKNTMLTDLSNAVENGLICLNDPDLIDEAKSYTRDDLMDKEPDPRLVEGHHFDLLMACAIAYQMNSHVKKPEVSEPWDPWLDAKLRSKERKNPAR